MTEEQSRQRRAAATFERLEARLQAPIDARYTLAGDTICAKTKPAEPATFADLVERLAVLHLELAEAAAMLRAARRRVGVAGELVAELRGGDAPEGDR